MIGAGINHDDVLVVDKSLTPRNNDIVIAILDACFTVKYYRRINQYAVVLESANRAYPSIKLTEVEIWGVVTGVVRKIK